MLYIHQTSFISPQQTFDGIDISVLHQPVEQKLKVIEPGSTGIPAGVMRRMSKAVRMGVMAALPLLQHSNEPAGIIIGTANAGMEDCFYFLKQMVDYNEGLLTPGNFVQSTPNALASQLSILTNNRGYNITHVHLGLAFENAIADAGMMIKENPGSDYLLGAVDDIPSYNYTLNLLAGWFKKEVFSLEQLYNLHSPGSIAGEGTAMFLVNGKPDNAIARLQAVETVHTEDEHIVREQLKNFLRKHLREGEKIDLLVTGENGDCRLLKYYTACEEMMANTTGIARYKHMCGEYPTATAMALWLGCYILQKRPMPEHAIKKHFPAKDCKNILIYNTYKGQQHSFILLSA